MKPPKAPAPLARPRAAVRLVHFADGPLGGQVGRWFEPNDPEFWDHVVRSLVPIAVDPATGEIPDGVLAFGEMERDGKKVIVGENQVAYRYRKTIRITAAGARVYELDPAYPPMPLTYDESRREWQTVERFLAPFTNEAGQVMTEEIPRPAAPPVEPGVS